MPVQPRASRQTGRRVQIRLVWLFGDLPHGDERREPAAGRQLDRVRNRPNGSGSRNVGDHKLRVRVGRHNAVGRRYGDRLADHDRREHEERADARVGSRVRAVLRPRPPEVVPARRQCVRQPHVGAAVARRDPIAREHQIVEIAVHSDVKLVVERPRAGGAGIVDHQHDRLLIGLNSRILSRLESVRRRDRHTRKRTRDRRAQRVLALFVADARTNRQRAGEGKTHSP